MSAEPRPDPPADRAARPDAAPVPGTHVLLVDPAVDERVAHDLASYGAVVTTVGTTTDALVQFGRLDPHVVVVAPSTPGPLAAADLVATVRQYSAALVVAALDAVDGPEAGPMLVAGAGAAVTRPYAAACLWEVVVRAAPGLGGHARLTFGPLELDTRTYGVTAHGRRLPDLPLKEFELLQALMGRAPGVVGNDELRASLWGQDEHGPTDNTIAVHVARLRHRLDGVARIRRLRGRGYALTLD